MASTPLAFHPSPLEQEVAQILLQFPLLSRRSEFSLGLIPSWPIRRKRSALESPPPSSDSSAAAVLPPPPSKKVKESSPTSPLVLNSPPLSRSESDENNAGAERSKKKPSLGKKSQYVEAIDELTNQNQGLKGEFEAMKQHYNRLKTINSELKAKKQEMILGSKNVSPIPEIGASSSAMKVVKQLTVESSKHHHHHHHHHHEFKPSINNQMAPTAEQSNNIQNFQIPIATIPLYVPSLGPLGIPDLNISFEEINQRNLSRFMAARARQNRIQICKNKNSGAAKLQSTSS